MACEDYDLALTIANAIKEFDRNLIFMVLAQSEMEKAAINLNMPYASEIFADRNYEDNATLISRTLNHALITDPQISLRNVMRMLQEKSIISYSGKKIPCNIDTICLHGDGKTAVSLAKFLREGLEKNGFILKPLDQLGKFQ
jgi:5-oxoprolinase (ATP-hydrolysing) subunit A